MADPTLTDLYKGIVSVVQQLDRIEARQEELQGSVEAVLDAQALLEEKINELNLPTGGGFEFES